MKVNWIDPDSKDGLGFKIIGSPCPHGNYFVELENLRTGLRAYLYPDLSIRTLPHFASGYNGYYTEKSEAITAINNFQKTRKKGTQMHNSTLNDMIKDTLNSFVSGKKMFTALDVTTKINNDNPGTHVYHNVVKNYVHGRYDKNDIASYKRVLADIGQPNPWLYYIPGHHDPKVYIMNAKSVPLPIPTVVAAKDSSLESDNDTLRKTIGKKNQSVVKKLTSIFSGFIGTK